MLPPVRLLQSTGTFMNLNTEVSQQGATHCWHSRARRPDKIRLCQKTYKRTCTVGRWTKINVEKSWEEKWWRKRQHTTLPVMHDMQALLCHWHEWLPVEPACECFLWWPFIWFVLELTDKSYLAIKLFLRQLLVILEPENGGLCI